MNPRNTKAGTKNPVPRTAHPTSEFRVAFCLERSKSIHSRLTKICEPDEITYLEKICATFVEEHNKEDLEFQISKLDKLQASIYKYQEEVLSLSGMGSAYENIDKIARAIRNVLGHLEDILCAALLGVEEVEKVWLAGKFAYQAADSV